MVDVFISYSRANQDVVRRLADAVKALGYVVWWDDELPPHLSYGDVITEKVGQAKAAIVVWSEGSIGSEWVRAEADLARNQKKLIQTAIDDCMPPMPFNQIQFASIGNWDGAPDHPGWRKVQESLTALCGPPPAGAQTVPASPPAPPPASPPAPAAAVSPPVATPSAATGAPAAREPTERTQIVFVSAPPRRTNTLLIAAIAASVAVILLIGGLVLFKDRGPANAASANTVASASPANGAAPAGATGGSSGQAAAGVQNSGSAAGADPPQILPDSSVRRLTPADVAGLDAGQLRLARNEIYARNGRIFQDPGLRAHFSRYSWYRPRSQEVVLNPVEQANVNLLQQASRQARPQAAASAGPQQASAMPMRPRRAMPRQARLRRDRRAY